MLQERSPSPTDYTGYGPSPYGGAGVPNSQAPSFSLILLVGLFVPLLITFAFALAPEVQVMALVLGLLGVVFIFATPFWGLVAFMGFLYIRPEESIQALAGYRLTLIVSLVTLAAMIFRMLTRREAPVKTPVTYLMGGFCAVMMLTSVQTGGMGEAIEYILKLFVLVLLVLNLVKTQDRYQTFVTALIVFTGYLSVYSIVLYFSGQAMKYQQDVLRAVGTGIFSDPNDLSAAIVGGMALAMTRIATARPFSKAFYVLITVVMMGAIFLTNSRGGLLAMLMVFGGYILVFSKRKGLALGIAGAVCLLMLAAAPSRMKDFDSQEESANSRFHFWANGLNMLKENPFGIGINQFPLHNDEPLHAHNSFVQCFAEQGLAGYFFWMGLIYYGFRRRPERETGAEMTAKEAWIDHRELLGARLALTGYLAACFWISRTYVPVLYMLMCLPIVQQLSASGRDALFVLTPQERRQDWGRIILICLGSILFIKVIVTVLQ